jgi:hypothetical protein
VEGFQICSKNFIPYRNLVAMATKRNYKNKVEKSFCEDPKSLELRYFAQGLDFCCIISSIGPLPKLFNFSPGDKIGPARGQ